MDGHENFFVNEESLNRLSDGRLSGAKPRRRTKSGAIIESLSKNAYVRRTPTRSGLVVFLGSDLPTFSGKSSLYKYRHLARQIWWRQGI